jgi:hypothetical protein
MAEEDTNPIADLTGINDPTVGTRTGVESSLSPYVGPYVTDMLGKGQALGSQDYEAYMGPLTAGASDLQQTAFSGLAGLTIPTETMGTYAPQEFTATAAQGLMNPYLMAALQPQIDEARRQSDIERQRTAGRLTQAGAYGGGRQAIMDAENQRNLLQNLAGITGTGYRDAYDRAMGQFNVQEDRGLRAARERDLYGLAALQKQADLGAVQRGIEAEGITADKLQFEQERDYPYKQVQYMQSLLQGLPIATESYSYSQPSSLQSGVASGLSVFELLNRLASPPAAG